MMESGVQGDPAVVVSPKSLIPSLKADLPDRKNEKKIRRRRVRTPSSVSGMKLGKDSLTTGSRIGTATPLLRWKNNDGEVSVDSCKESDSGEKSSRGEKKAVSCSVSARKLAAGLWHSQLPESTSGGNGLANPSCKLGFESAVEHAIIPHPSNYNGTEYDSTTKVHSQSPSPSHPQNGIKLEASVKFTNAAMERATKWDSKFIESSDGIYPSYSHLKLLEDHQMTSVSAVPSLQAELEQCRSRICELEAERRSSKKKLEKFLRKLSEEKAAWRSREHEKMRSIIDNVKNDFKQEKKKCQRLEIMNSKLVSELAEAKRTLKRFLQDYEKERKARDLMEEVCDELAKEIGSDKAEAEALKRESMKVREEVEEERKMLQMAELWREERVQMKLIEAKVILEKKYSHLSELVVELESFLRSRSNRADEAELRAAAALREAATSVNIQDIKEFSYQPPNSEDFFSVLEDLHLGEANRMEIGQYGESPASHASKMDTVSQESSALDKNVKRYSNCKAYRNGYLDEDGSGWETVSHVEEHRSINSPGRSDPSVNGHCEESIASGSAAEWEGFAENKILNAISETYSPSAKLSRRNRSSIARRVRPLPNKGEIYRAISADMQTGRLSSGILSPDKGSRNGTLSPNDLGHWSSPDSGNMHITRGMKGCIEWPHGALKNSLKAKLLEARLEGQKAQLRQVPKQKI